ncbi:transglycosylase SLT domain-containing protein [Agrococcus sp. Marseille-Q4369]|nr:transglycosylase SLT domain-containing protein [Agrococcus sp. Marseille-Q4369]
MVLSRGWGEDQYSCLYSLWQKESNWNVYAQNRSSGAYGIPQSLPGSKMASAGADWQTNPVTQITWGLGYISGRYGTPCGAWAHSQRVGWY